MIANAIGPQKTVGAIAIKPSTVEIALSMIGRKRGGRFDAGVPDVTAVGALGLDLVDENDRVAGDHVDERQNVDDGY